MNEILFKTLENGKGLYKIQKATLGSAGFDLVAAILDKKSLKVAKRNKSNLLDENRLKFCHADFSEFNTLNYDLIVCNPPYVSASSKNNMLKDVQDFEPEAALFAKEYGLRCFKMVLDNLIKFENKKQLIIFEIGYNQLKPIQKLLKNTGFQLISVEKDISDIPRCIVTKRI